MTPDVAKHQEDIIFALTSYRRDHYDRAIISTPPGIHALVRPYLTDAFPSEATATLGDLHALPAEIMVEVCRAMDVKVLFRFRQTNRRARQIVSGIRAYQDTTTHALDSFRAILRLGITSTVTILDLYGVLHGPPKCNTCNRFGYLLFLPRMQRCCPKCLENSNDPRWGIAPVTTVAKLIGVRERELKKTVAITRSLTGPFFHPHYRGSRRYNLVTEIDVEREFPALGPKAEGFPGPTSKAFERRFLRFTSYRYMVTTFLPHMNRDSGNVDIRYSCAGCRRHGNNGRFYPRPSRHDVTACFSREEFLQHFGTCHFAQRIWIGY